MRFVSAFMCMAMGVESDWIQIALLTIPGMIGFGGNTQLMSQTSFS